MDIRIAYILNRNLKGTNTLNMTYQHTKGRITKIKIQVNNFPIKFGNRALVLGNFYDLMRHRWRVFEYERFHSVQNRYTWLRKWFFFNKFCRLPVYAMRLLLRVVDQNTVYGFGSFIAHHCNSSLEISSATTYSWSYWKIWIFIWDGNSVQLLW